MIVYLNEKSLEDCVDINLIPQFLCENISNLEKKKNKIHTRFSELESWLNEWESCLDATSKAFTILQFQNMEDCQNKNRNYYYYYFNHQDIELSISENISITCVADATDKILSEQPTVILNIPNTKFCKRPFLPIIKSPYDSKLPDQLANIPCFDNAKKVIQFVFLQEKIKPLINENTEFELFSKEYLSFYNSFNSDNWEPKIFIENNILNSTITFPLSTIEIVSKHLANWKPDKKSYNENVAKYKELGGIVLELHGYSHNKQLSSYYNYNIYEAGYSNNKILISIDEKSGEFEVLDVRGTHIGVYGYDGNYIRHYKDSKNINTHSLKEIPINMFIFK